MRKTIVTIVLTIVVGLIVAVGGLLLFAYSGAYDISTRNHDNGAINWYLDMGATRAVKHHAKGIQAPPLSDPQMVQAGFGHYDEMCVTCHGAPGVDADDIAKGLWPEAPNLAKTVPDWTPAELFWIVKYGIKFSAMPAWGPTHSDEKIWQMVAFLEKLPHLSPAEYQQMKGKEGGKATETKEK